MKSAIVTGAGGFIGSHFTRYLHAKGYHVIGIDIKYPEFSPTRANKFVLADLTDTHLAFTYIQHVDELYMFAADMGGVEYIESTHANIMRTNTLINVNTLEAAKKAGIPTMFFPSTACVYPQSKQKSIQSKGLKETDVYPADPDSSYGWEKLFAEQLCQAYTKDHGMKIHIARLHNVYGPEGTYEGGREKSPAALCRKVALADSVDTVEVFGDGKQIRSYCYIDDCCEGIFRLTHSKHLGPVNIGSSRPISINDLALLISKIAQKKIAISHNLTAPLGVRARSSDNGLIKKLLGWEPRIPLEAGFRKTYQWIERQVQKEK